MSLRRRLVLLTAGTVFATVLLASVLCWFAMRSQLRAVDTSARFTPLADVVLAVGAGLVLERLVEPEWPADLDEVWGQWSPLRGALVPGTAIYVTVKPG